MNGGVLWVGLVVLIQGYAQAAKSGRRNFGQGGAEALESRKQGRLNMKPERNCQAPPPMVVTDSA
jgi:hypothetical protein